MAHPRSDAETLSNDMHVWFIYWVLVCVFFCIMQTFMFFWDPLTGRPN